MGPLANKEFCQSYLQCLLTHSISPGFAHLQYSDEFSLKNDTIAEKSPRIISICNKTKQNKPIKIPSSKTEAVANFSRKILDPQTQLKSLLL